MSDTAQPGAEPAGAGRPPFAPTREHRNVVRIMASHGISQKTIATAIGPGIDHRTLRKHFGEELRSSREWVKARMIAALVRSGINGNVNAIKYWLATHGGPEWRLQTGDADLPSAAAGNTTIIIKGGLPPTIYSAAEADISDDDPPVRTNGNGNGADHSS